MSLLKVHGGNKSKRNSGIEDPGERSGPSINSTEPPQNFRKSISIDPPGSDGERPHSQQSSKGGGGKKKILSNFLSNLFGSKISETEANPPSSSNLSGRKSSSHESVNSVLSSASFSYVTPKKYRGKPMKGKRIPVDDPNYSSSKNDGRKTLGATIDKIGIKIGLKKKYNLQSCESLQYIDACGDEPSPISTPAAGSSIIVPTDVPNEIQDETPLASSLRLSDPSSNPVVAELAAECQAITKHFSQGNTDTPTTPESKVSYQKSPETNSPSSSQQHTSQLAKVVPYEEPTLTPAISTNLTTQISKEEQSEHKEDRENQNGSSEHSENVKTQPQLPNIQSTTDEVLSSKTTELASPSIQLTSGIASDTTSTHILISTSSLATAVEESKSPRKQEFTNKLQIGQTPREESSSSAVAVASTSKAVASSSSSTFSGPFHCPAPLTPHIAPGCSNTWSSSTKRKRRAPPPPSELNNPRQKFANGVSSESNTPGLDIIKDVPSSSSYAAALTRFTRLEEMPSSCTFEIRPRRKERSVEPSPVSRPVSHIIKSHNNCNTLFSSHQHRYQHHKRSSSETYSTNTRGRVHKPGKKKAPPPPNPFGDPNASDEPDITTISPPLPVTPTTTDNTDNNRAPASTGTSTETFTSQVNLFPLLPQSQQGISKLIVKPPSGKILTSNPIPSSLETPTLLPSPPVLITNGQSPTTIISSVITSTSTTTTASPGPVPQPLLACTSPNNGSENQENLSNLNECTVDELEEIRQNILNDQQERQQLGLTQIQDSSPQGTSTVEESSFIPTTVTDLRVESSPSSSQRNAVSDDDVRSARQTLEVLSANVARHNSSSTAPDPKPKLAELKKEAERSPLNASKSKSRPISIGSSIYESPLALLLGRSSGNTTASGTEQSSAENSPRVTPKPWYKRSTPVALAKQFTSKSKQSSSVKPFTALVKFSELDKEAARIVEENRRKSAEQRFNENAQELIALFSSSFPESSAATNASENPGDSPSLFTTQPIAKTSPSKLGVNPIKVSTNAQVHPTSDEHSKPSTTTKDTPRVSASTTTPSISSVSAEGAASSASTNSSPTINGGSSSPTFQSVHAASKHRQIKPLHTTSPIANVRSEKLAIVQPQTNTSVPNKSSEGNNSSQVSALINTLPPSTPTSSQNSSTMITFVSTSTTTSTASPTASTENPQSAVETGQPTATTMTSVEVASPSILTQPPSFPISKFGNESQWDCPRCTLKNPNWRMLCEVCFQRKDTGSSNSYISSILQRVNSESNKVVSSTSTTTSTSTAAIKPMPERLSSSRITAPVSSTISTISSTASVSTEPSPHSQLIKNNIPPASPPPCENFLSQLPAKQDLSKEEKLHGIKLHEDPELEELNVGKLREARLAYFQKQKTSSHSTSTDVDDESVENPASTNDLGASRKEANHNQPTRISNHNEYAQLHQNSSRNSHKGATSHTFSDNEDDFLDDMLQLESNENENTTTVANITDSLPRPWKSPPTASLSSIAATSPTPPILASNCGGSSTPIISFTNRFRPRLEAIREGSSQDYTYCYSSSEIAQIYENWQAGGDRTSGNKISVGEPSQVSRSNFPRETHLLEQTSTSTSPHHNQQQHLEPYLHVNSNIYPVSKPTSGSGYGGNSTHVISLLPVEHQPYANNRHSNSPEENYENVNVGTTIVHQHPPPANTPTLNETANFSCAPVPLVCFPSFAPNNIANHHTSINLDESHINNMSRGDRHERYRYGSGENSHSHNYENNVNLNPGGSASRRLTYEDYRRMGAIPKGYNLNSLRNDDWSSESSCDTDSSRSFWGRSGGSVPGGYQDSLHGMTRRGNLDFSQAHDTSFPDSNMTVGNLMKRLEAAIANGDNRLAATLAHDLALMKVNCVVGKINQPFTIRVYVEDRCMQQGPFLIQVSAMMTVRELKSKIESDWGIPAGFQKWILGRKMAEDDNHSLASFEMAQDSMAFLFLVTPEIGNAVRSGIVPVDSTSKPINTPDFVNQPSTSSRVDNGVTGNGFGRKSMSPVRQSRTSSYNINVENTPHVYNKFSLDNVSSAEKTVQHSKSPVVTRKKPDVHHTSEINTSPTNKPGQDEKCSGSKSLSSCQPVQRPSKLTSAAKSGLNEKVLNKEESPPPLPTRSPIPHSSNQLEIKSAKGGSKPVSKSHSNTPERGNSAAGSLTKSSKQKASTGKQNNVSPTSVNKERQSHARPNPQTHAMSNATQETISAASALTISLQQKLAEFKVVAEQTFSKTSITPPGKDASPTPPSRSGNNHTVTGESPRATPPRRVGKSQLATSKEKLQSQSSASSSTEKLTKAPISDIEKVVIKENRFNGVLLPTPKDTENLKPPERTDKALKDKEIKQDSSKQKPPKSVKAVTASEQVKAISKSDETGGKKPPIVPQHLQTAAIKTSDDIAEVSPKKNEEESVKHLAKEEDTIPQPKPRGLKKQQSVEKAVPTEESSAVAPKPAPRTTGGNRGTRAHSESKSPEAVGMQKDNMSPEQLVSLSKLKQDPKSPEPSTDGIYKASKSPESTTSFAGMNKSSKSPELTTSFAGMNKGSMSPEPNSLLKNIPTPTEHAPQYVTVDDWCQTTLPFLTPKHRNTVAVSPSQILVDHNNVSGADYQNDRTPKGLLRPSAFVPQTQNNITLVPKEINQTTFKDENATVGTSIGGGAGASSSVLLPILAANSFSSIFTSAVENIKNFASTSTKPQPMSNAAHVQPLPIQQSSNPTAFVVPTPSLASRPSTLQQDAAAEKSKEDNVQSYLKMLELMEKQDLIFTTEDAECPVCFVSISIGEGVILRDCLHVFCKECLIGCVEYADESTVKCPYRDSSYACNNNLQEREIKALVPSEVFEKYLARSVKLAESVIINTFHCKNPDCTGWCVFEDDVNIFLCPVCKKRNCLTCAAIHDGMDCQKYQRELAIAAETDEDAKQSRLMLEKMIQRGEALECPACHVVLLKKWGCDWVRCSYCKTEICWVTKGFRWGKGGKGDNSGGCKCGVNGVKCHPKCTYCH